MFVFFDPETRRVHHVVHMHPIDYGKWLENNPPQNEDWVETNQDFAFEEIEVLPDKTLRRRQPMTLDYPRIVQTGVEFPITGVPEGVTIVVNGAEEGVMDASNLLEFTAGVGGRYRFRFEGPGYIAQEIEIEAQG